MNIRIIFKNNDSTVYENFESISTYWNDDDNKHYYAVVVNWTTREYLVEEVAQILIS